MSGSRRSKAIVGNKIAPGLLDHYLGATGFEGQQTSEPEDPERAHNLWEPLDAERDHGAHGSFDARASAWSVQLCANKNRNWLALAGVALLGAVGAAWARNDD